jgi:hypothetical protein
MDCGHRLHVFYFLSAHCSNGYLQVDLWHVVLFSCEVYSAIKQICELKRSDELIN